VIEPVAETQKLLQDCRAVLKTVPGGVRIVVPATEDNLPFIPLPTNPRLGFHLRLQNSDFVLFTDTSEIDAAAAALYTNSTPARNGRLALGSRDQFSSERLAVKNPAKNETFVLAGQPLAGLKAGAFVVQGLGGKAVRVNYNVDNGTISLNTAGATPGTTFTVTYPVGSRLERGVFADVEINYDSSPVDLTENTTGFEVVFNVKEARWKYYLVADSTMTSAALSDQDQVVVFAASDQTDLTKSPDPADPIAARLAQRYPNRQTFRFLSSAFIPCQQSARKGIQLQLNGTKAMDSLPTPALQSYSLDTRNATQEYTLYQIVKYFTPSFSSTGG
jgi:hypothetical protein